MQLLTNSVANVKKNLLALFLSAATFSAENPCLKNAGISDTFLIHNAVYNPDISRKDSVTWPFPAVEFSLASNSVIRARIEEFPGRTIIHEEDLGKYTAGKHEVTLNQRLWDGTHNKQKRHGLFALIISSHAGENCPSYDNRMCLFTIDRTPPVIERSKISLNKHLSLKTPLQIQLYAEENIVISYEVLDTNGRPFISVHSKDNLLKYIVEKPRGTVKITDTLDLTSFVTGFNIRFLLRVSIMDVAGNAGPSFLFDSLIFHSLYPVPRLTLPYGDTLCTDCSIFSVLQFNINLENNSYVRDSLETDIVPVRFYQAILNNGGDTLKKFAVSKEGNSTNCTWGGEIRDGLGTAVPGKYRYSAIIENKDGFFRAQVDTAVYVIKSK